MSLFFLVRGHGDGDRFDNASSAPRRPAAFRRFAPAALSVHVALLRLELLRLHYVARGAQPEAAGQFRVQGGLT